MSAQQAKASNNEWWRGGVIYQIYPRSYQDSNGDGVGDLPGITARLEHVAQLGADGIWLSPFFKSPMKDFGYDVSDYRDVDPMFGTLDDFKILVKKAHDLGLKVVVWTVNRPEDMALLIDMGVDGIISDRPDLLREVAEAKGIALPAGSPVSP